MQREFDKANLIEGVHYRYFDISEDPEAMAYAQRLGESEGTTSLPLIEFPDGSVLSGYRPDKFREKVSTW